MGLAVRIIPTILVNGWKQVKGERFKSWRIVGLAKQAALIHATRGVDELCILDVRATAEGRGPDLRMIEELSKECFSPLAIGGGVISIDDVRALLLAGADKVVIGTHVPAAAYLSAREFGSQAIVASVDVTRGKVAWGCGNLVSAFEPDYYARYCEHEGAGEILLQSIDRDGTMEGYDIELIRSVCDSVDIPVIASGGCKSYEDMYNAIQAGASAVAAGALFQFTDSTPQGAAEYLHSKGVEVRLRECCDSVN